MNCLSAEGSFRELILQTDKRLCGILDTVLKTEY